MNISTINLSVPYQHHEREDLDDADPDEPEDDTVQTNEPQSVAVLLGNEIHEVNELLLEQDAMDGVTCSPLPHSLLAHKFLHLHVRMAERGGVYE